MGYPGTCNICKQDKELVWETGVCESCLLESQSHWRFCKDCLRSYKEGEVCPVCGKE